MHHRNDIHPQILQVKKLVQKIYATASERTGFTKFSKQTFSQSEDGAF